ncbi:MAG: cobalamin biosynthesis protein CbiX [Rhodoferax sp.]|nr:MAG: cobalamin biosynthesis protein CbiX [Rhodoferax sp.]
MNNSSPNRGVILFAHGSRDPLWHRPITTLAQRIQQASPHTEVVCAYLELSAPDLPTAAQALIAKGVPHIRVVPLFLGMGKHAREDLPLLMEALRTQHAGTEFELSPAVGEHPLLLDALCTIALQNVPSCD